MASYLLRRSGIAVGLVAELIGWRADTIYQIGIGQHHEEVDVLAAEWPGCRFIGCEPHPGIVRELNGKYPGIVIESAVSDHTGTARLFFRSRHKDGSSLCFPTPDDGPDYEDVLVCVNTMDGLFQENHGGRTMLWMDCEGQELRALHGGENFLRRVDVVNIEMTGKPISREWCKPLDVHRWLVARGFYQQWIHSHRSIIGQYDAMYVREGLFHPEYSSNVYEVERFGQRNKEKVA